VADAPHDFKRTSCACADCVACCHEQPGPLAPGDLEAIAAHLDRPVRDVLELFWASPGALVRDLRTRKERMIGTITPRMRGGRCVFLDADDRCAVHPVAPFGCAFVDTHMSMEEWHPRAQWLYATIEQSDAYRSLRRMLQPATSYRPRKGPAYDES